MPSPAQTVEANIDGMVGPTHNYAGLSSDNLASTKNRALTSHPKQSALESLNKAKFVSDLGIPQFLLPPQMRPDLKALSNWGFSGKSRSEIIERVWKTDPRLLAAAYSSSSMWTANAATLTPSSDSQDGRVHVTPANLLTTVHRTLESKDTARLLKLLLPEGKRFVHHPFIKGGVQFSDEGAANHMRLCGDYAAKGLHLFTYGINQLDAKQSRPKRVWARQSLLASQAIARSHTLTGQQALFIQQNPKAIDARAFHTDITATSNRNLLLLHRCAFANQSEALDRIRRAYEGLNPDRDLHIIVVDDTAFSLETAIDSYVFNSQLLSPPKSKHMTLLCPLESREHAHVRHYLEGLIADSDNPISDLHYIDVSGSMRNGGGPACLRLRAVLTPSEFASIPEGFRLTQERYFALVDWIGRHYREQIAPTDLRDPLLCEETRSALFELEAIFGIDGFYQP